MKNQVGLWIDHRHALIVRFLETGEVLKSHIISKLPKHIRFSGVSHDKAENEAHDDYAENKRDRRFKDLLNRYYAEVIAKLENADSILILGPGEAKIELQKQLENKTQAEIMIEAADKMTENQILANLRQHFQDNNIGFVK